MKIVLDVVFEQKAAARLKFVCRELGFAGSSL